MAKYTIELRHLIEAGFPLFDFPYNIYDESKRLEFQQHFIHHFYFREIGCETPERFKYYLIDKFNTIFPYYNELFRTESLKYDELTNYDVEETYTKDNITANTESAGIKSTQSVNNSQKTNESLENEISYNNRSNQEIHGNKGEHNKLNSHTTSNTNITLENSGENTDETINATKNKDTKTSTTENEEKSKNTNTSESTTTDTINQAKSDTPQGKIEISSTDYVSSLQLDKHSKKDTQKSTNENTGNNTSNNRSTNESVSDSTVKNTNKQKLHSSNEENKTDESNVTNETTYNTEETSNLENTGTSENNSIREVNNTSLTETSSNSNQNKSANGSINESFTRHMRGNIGVQTSMDMLEKHIALQKKLKSIEIMFFNECEDLFMQIF